jgi:hypothetical protein
MTTHAMNQITRLYAAIELVMRKALELNTPLTMAGIKAVQDIQAAAKTHHQIRDAVINLLDKGYVVAEGSRLERRYKWKEGAESFSPSKAQVTAMSKRPGKVTDPMPDNVVTQAAAPLVSQEVELVVAGVTIIVSKNAATGRPRITIEG